MHTGLLIFVRYESRRLPGKALRELAGRPILGHVIDRMRRVIEAPQIVVATSESDADERIAAFAVGEKIAIFRGALNDVAQRALNCAESFSFDRIVRISGDSPFLDPALVDRVLRVHDQGDLDLATNIAERTFPIGQSVEVIATPALRRMVTMTTDLYDREHVTPYFYKSPDIFRIRNIAAHENLGDVRLAVDTEEDLERARFIAAHATTPPALIPIDELVRLARKWSRPPAVASS